MRNVLHLPLCLLCLALFLACRPAGQDTETPQVFSATPQALQSKPLQGEMVPSQREGAPVSLDTPDGVKLRLADLHAQVVMEGPLAFTELRLSFDNPEARVLEGRFQITLPDRAAISRFAMRIGDQWQEAEMVERQEAQRAYEDFLHRRQDPALLEKEAGNEFRARIFPIPANGRKEILISYSQELESSTQPYVLPLKGLPKLDNLRIELRGGAGKANQQVSHKAYLPQGDFLVPQDTSITGLSAGNYVVARVRPRVSSVASPPQDLLVLVDTSASRALGYKGQVEMVSGLLAAFPKLEKVTVAAFDQSVETVYEGPASSFSGQPLLERKALGATDLAAALDWAAGQQGHTRLLLITDGITTAGPQELGAKLHDSGLRRLDVILVGGIRDKDRMETLVCDKLELDGGVFDGGMAPAELARRLSLTVNSGLDVAVEGAKWVWPQTLDNVQPGDDRLVYAELSKPALAANVSLGGEKAVAVALRQAQVEPLLTRSGVVAQIARLESLRAAAKESEKQGLAKEIVALSTSHRVLSDLTALLVLETEADYQRFHIDRKALTDVLEVGAEGLVLKHRDDIAMPDAKQPAPRPPVDNPMPAASATPAATPITLSTSGRTGNQGLGGAAPGYQSAPEGASYMIRQSRRTEARGSMANSTEHSDYAASAPPAPEESHADRVQGLIERGSGAEDDGVVIASRQLHRESLDRGAGATSATSEGSLRGSYAYRQSVPQNNVPNLSGKMSEVEGLLKKRSVDAALKMAWDWQQAEPGDVLALLALGDCLEAKKDLATAARVYGSIIDLYPSRADLRRFAGARLEGLGASALPLAVDSFSKAVKQRPDHVSSHRFLAMALARQGLYEEAFAALEAGLSQNYPEGRFAGHERLLKDDLGLMGAAWAAREPKRAAEIRQRLLKAHATMADKPSLRFILTWETDANDVDFHIRDSNEDHAFYGDPRLPSGGELFADVTTGYGPECFAIPGPPASFPYALSIHYYARGPMGYGMGQLELLQHDGKGGLIFEQRPYVIMSDGAYVDLGQVPGPLKAR